MKCAAALKAVRNKPRMLTPEEREALRQDLKETMAILKRLREEEAPYLQTSSTLRLC